MAVKIREFMKLKSEKGGGGYEATERGVFVDILSATLSPALVAANTAAEEEFTFTGVVSGDIILSVEKPTHQAGLTIAPGRVTGDGTLKLKFGNHTAAGITPTAAEVYKVAVMRINK